VNASHQSPPAGWDCHVHVFDGGTLQADAHYRPVPRRLPEIEAHAQAHGCGHLVLVQPSVYGSDNSLLLDVLRRSGGRHRGIVVLHGKESAADVEAMHAAGVRGLRVNLVSPVGNVPEQVPLLLRGIAPALREMGWHVQCYVEPHMLPQLVEWQQATGARFVLDHLAGLTAAHHDDEPSWAALRKLAAAGCWIKLSGWYRLQAQPPYGALQPLVRRVANIFEGRTVWGSDWPHTSFPPQELPSYESVWQPVVRALGEEAALRVKNAGEGLYS
jgi:predicted TIM-barrel fold metal-dependent hydrolase